MEATSTPLITLTTTDIDLFHYDQCFPPFIPRPTLSNSLASLGQLTPIWVYKTNATYQLLDGKARITTLGDQPIAARCLPHQSDLLPLFFETHQQKIMASTISKLYFLLGWTHQYPQSMTRCCHYIGIHPYAALLNHSKRITRLPLPIQQFCHDKKIGFKPSLSLAAYPPLLLTRLLQLHDNLPLSARSFLQLAEYVHDISRRHNTDSMTILDDACLNQQNNHTPSQKTERIYQYLRAQHQPTMTQLNESLHQLTASLPTGVDVRWDTACEEKYLDIYCRVQTNHTLDQLPDILRKEIPLLKQVLAKL